jgi:hypothetical protein
MGKRWRGLRVHRAGEQMGEKGRDLSRVIRKRVSSSETSVSIYQTTWWYIAEDNNLHTWHCENLKYYPQLSRISGSHSGEYEDVRLLGCGAVVWSSFSDVSEVLAASIIRVMSKPRARNRFQIWEPVGQGRTLAGQVGNEVSIGWGQESQQEEGGTTYLSPWWWRQQVPLKRR